MKGNQSEIIAAFIKLTEYAPKVYEAARSAVNTEDKLTQDLLHKIELEGNDRSIRNKAATELRTSRLDRRYYKDIAEELEPLYEFLQDGTNRKVIKKLEQVLGKMRKVEAYHANRTYHPRVNRMEEKE